jgi:DNA-directed RNA polymerase subunit alpha
MTNHLERSIDDLEISVRVAKCLSHLGIATVGELLQKTTKAELLWQPNFGPRSLRQLELILEAMGLRLRSGRDQPHDVDKPKQPGVEIC